MNTPHTLEHLSGKVLTPIWQEIFGERLRQDGRWGGPKHDDTHSPRAWHIFILRYSGRAVRMPWNRELFREQMVKVAALAVAAIQWCDRLPKEQG